MISIVSRPGRCTRRSICLDFPCSSSVFGCLPRPRSRGFTIAARQVGGLRRFFIAPGLLDKLSVWIDNPPLALLVSALSLGVSVWCFVELFCLGGRKGPNRFGSDPLAPVAPVTPADAGALGVLEDVLKSAGFEVHRVTFSEPGAADVDNLYARIGASAPHITFAGHTDVVPPGDETAWTHGAFSGDVKDGFLYGRGAVDMKGGIACSVAAVLEHLASHGGKPRDDGKGSSSFLNTGDEEDVSVNGTIKLLQWAAARGEK